MKVTAEYFKKATGQEPKQDDLDRSNCPDAGKVGHDCCGWNSLCNLPNFMAPYASVKVERFAKDLGLL
jgi:hypothetical protein